MKKKTKRILIGGLIALFLIGAACAGTFYYYIFYPQFHPQKTTYIYIDKDDTPDSIYNKVKKQGHPKSFSGFLWMAKWRDYNSNIHTGCYAIRPEESVYHVFSRLYRGYQEPINLTISNVRTLDRLARSVGKQLMIDSTEIAAIMNDSLFQKKMGYTKDVVVLTRHKGYRKEIEGTGLTKLVYRKYPEFVKAVYRRPSVYNHTLDEIEKWEEEGKIFVIRPSVPLTIGRMEADPKKIKEVYELGRDDARRQIEDMKVFLGIE